MSVSEQEREVAEALFGLANMAALHQSSPPASPARSASPVAKSEDAIAKSSAAITVAAAALMQASSPALSADGDDDSQPIISLKSSVPVSASASVSAAPEEKRQKSAKREGPPEDGAPSASTSLPPLEGAPFFLLSGMESTVHALLFLRPPAEVRNLLILQQNLNVWGFRV